MGKPTVDDNLKLDARYWAKPGIAKYMTFFAKTYQESGRASLSLPQIAADDDRKSAGFLEMSWSRGGGYGYEPQKVAQIEWACTDAKPFKPDFDQALSLTLLYAKRRDGQNTPTWQDVSLCWYRDNGQNAPWPVFLCPICDRRCRYLHCGSSRDQPYAGMFVCRLCAGMCYRSQMEYTPWRFRGKTLFEIALMAGLHPERLTQEECDRLIAATDKPAEEIHARVTITRTVTRTINGVSVEDSPHRVYLQKRRRGRPSLKRARQQQRECARLKRQQQEDLKEKRPPGRPKERRGYDAAKRRESGCSGHVAADEGYCVSCRAARRIIGGTAFTTKNGRSAIKGQCEECGRGLCRMGAKVAVVTVEQSGAKTFRTAKPADQSLVLTA